MEVRFFVVAVVSLMLALFEVTFSQDAAIFSTPEHFLIIDQNNMHEVACRLKTQSLNDLSYGMIEVARLCDGVEDCLGGADEQLRACNFKEKSHVMKKLHEVHDTLGAASRKDKFHSQTDSE